MSSAPETAAPPPLTKPTLFVSYASEDREAARRLRDALEAAGLDVWYDENELGGGDAWDQKIRRQIRDCDYFMPVISATTERRKEGYFRREWRLAAERTLDMADDVTFLLPVSIDTTAEAGARVPDKFLAVQWLRLPEGRSTPALEALCRRLASGAHPPPVATPPARTAGPARAAAPASSTHVDGPPPMPAFPHPPEKGGLGHGIKFLAEVVWWAITAAWLLFRRAPRWLRVVLSIWLVFWLMSRCSSGSGGSREPEATPKTKTVDKEQIRKALATAKDAAGEAKSGDAADIVQQFARGLAVGLRESDAADKRLVAVPFAGVADEGKFPAAVFTPLYGRLAVERTGEVGVSSAALPAATDEALAARGRELDATFILGGHVEPSATGEELVVRLIHVEDAAVAWSGRYAIAGADPAAIAEQIATGVLAAVPKR
jgi:hypothetical protein